MDALSDVLRVPHLTGGVFLHAEFFAPWCIASRLTPELCRPVLGPESHLILFHYAVEGGFHLRVEGGAGEVVAFRPGLEAGRRRCRGLFNNVVGAPKYG